MKRFIYLSPIVALSVSCTTLDQSLRLGAATGAVAGAAASYGAVSANGHLPTLEQIGVGAGIGLGLGLITSYFVHKQVAGDREENTRQTEIYFGDLPPNPFVIPQNTQKKGAR